MKLVYENFDLSFYPQGGGRFWVRSVSPAGEHKDQFEVPCQLCAVLARTTGLVPEERPEDDGLRSFEVVSAPASSGVGSSREVGAALFTAVFHGAIRAALDFCRGWLAGHESRRLRLRLVFDLTEGATAELAELPWEQLYDPATREFLALAERYSVVRYLRAPHPAALIAQQPPLRLLLVSGEPPRDLPLELAQERAAILAQWRDVAGVEVRPLVNWQLADLTDALAWRPHVVHFMGHGSFDAEQGGRLLNGDRGLSAEWLAQKLGGSPGLYGVFLNACDTARHERGQPFTGVASALVQAGVPVVLAMRSPIQDHAAILFAQRVYGGLAQGDRIDGAVRRGRLALQDEVPGEAWSVPALFMRLREGSRTFGSLRPGVRTDSQPLMVPRALTTQEPRLWQRMKWFRRLVGVVFVTAAVVIVVIASRPELRVVTAAAKDDDGRLVRLCNPDEPEWSGISVEEAAAEVHDGVRRYVVEVEGQRVALTVSSAGDRLVLRRPLPGVEGLPACHRALPRVVRPRYPAEAK